MYKEIVISQILGKNLISMQTGDKLNKILLKELKQSNKLLINFDNILSCASPFFNSAFGSLLKNMSLLEFKNKIEIKGISIIGKEILDLVLSNADNYYNRS